MDLSTFSLLALWIAATWAWGRAFLPLSRLIFPSLLDGGLAAGRLLALVLVALVAFIGAQLHLVSLQMSPLLMIAAPVAAQLWLRRDATRQREYLEWARTKRRGLLASDAVFVASWLGFAWVRLMNPALSDLEKPMDIALFASAWRASWLPFENPWLAGADFTNYYYFGPVLGSLWARLLVTPPHVGYNLAQPLFCAFLASILAALCATLCRPKADEGRAWSLGAWGRGAWAMAIVAWLGHFEPLRQMRKAGLAEDKAVSWLKPSEVNWWETSRVIPDTINEYPAFSQLIGDAHAHFFALPLGALLFSLAWSLFHTPQVLEARAPEVLPTRAHANGVAARPTSRKSKSKKRRARVPQAAASTSVATIEAEDDEPEAQPEIIDDEARAAQVLAARRDRRERWARVLLLGAMLGAFIVGNTWDVPLYALVAMGAIVLSQPLAARGAGNKAPFATLVFGHLKSSAPMVAAMLGVAVVLAVPYLSRFKPAVQGVQFEFWIPPAGSWALFWTGIVGLALVSQSGADRADEPRRRMWQVLALCGTIALFAPNVFYIKGFFGDGSNRHQDTVFKFGLQAWLLLGVAGTCGAWWLLDSMKAATRRKYFGAWVLAWAIPLVCSLGVVAFRTGAQRSALAPTLDGASYLPAEDARAVAWLSANARPGDRVLEATRPGGDRYNYVEYGHISALSGVPAPVGWTWHAVYWGADFGRDVQPRLDAIQNIWNATGTESARAELRALGITHVFIGALERRTYPPASIEVLKQAGRVAFQEGETAIIEVAR